MARKKISKDAPAAENYLAAPVLVQLRLAPGLAARLRAEGAPYRRKLPAEIIHRLQDSSGASDTSAYGWVNPKRDRALGAALGVLAGRVEEVSRMSAQQAGDRIAALSMLRLAIDEAFERLGASYEHLSPEECAFARLEGRRFMSDLLRPDLKDQPPGSRPDLEIIARMAEEWEVKP